MLAKTIFQQGETDKGIELISEAAAKMRQHAVSNPQSDRAQQNSAMFDSEKAVMLLYVGQTELAEELFQNAAERF